MPTTQKPECDYQAMLDRNTSHVEAMIQTCTEMIRRGGTRENVCAHLIRLADEEPGKMAVAAVIAVWMLAQQAADVDALLSEIRAVQPPTTGGSGE